MTKGDLYAQRYRLGELLGRGAVGEVWLAHDSDLQIDVALKFLKKSFTEEDHEILKRETRQARSLSHKNILTVFDYHQPEGEKAAISMEYASEGSLAGYLNHRGKAFEVNDIATWMLQACDALWYAHNQNVIHRDINPTNLMLGSENQLKVADFGIAAQLVHQLDSETRKTLGRRATMHFASPQILQNIYESHFLNDIYALGVTIFVLLTGTFPFEDPRKNRWKWDPDNLISMNERRQQKGIDGEAVPATWEYAVARCLAEDPNDRPSSMKELAEMLGSEWLQSDEWNGPGETAVELPPLPPQELVVEIRDLRPAVESRGISSAVLVILFAAVLGLLAGIFLAAYSILVPR